MARIPRRLILLAFAAALAACDRPSSSSAAPPSPPSKASFKGIDITGAEYAKVLSLADFDGKRRSLADWKGKVIVVFFGYTQCPDVCPTTMAELAAVKRQLGADGDRVQGVFVTVDPDRDTPQVLKAYVQNFDPTFVALRGTADETKAVTREFKVFYARVPGTTEGSYTVDHTAGSYVFDTQGRVRLVSRYGAGADALAHDLKLLLAEP
jgi:protein SCO1/2